MTYQLMLSGACHWMAKTLLHCLSLPSHLHNELWVAQQASEACYTGNDAKYTPVSWLEQ